MIKPITFFSILSVTVLMASSQIGSAQSLGDLARQQREKKENEKSQAGNPSRVFTNDNVHSDSASKSQFEPSENAAAKQGLQYLEKIDRARKELAVEQRKLEDLREYWNTDHFHIQEMTGAFRQQQMQYALEAQHKSLDQQEGAVQVKKQILADLEREFAASKASSENAAGGGQLFYTGNWAELREEKWTWESLQAVSSSELPGVVLGKLDVPFPDRADWERRIFDQKERYSNALHDYTKEREAYLNFQEATQRSSEPKTQRDGVILQERVMALKRARDKATEEETKLKALIDDGRNRAALRK